MSNMDKKQLVKLLSYMSTFDGGLYVVKKNAKFIMNMREENKDYILWVQNTLNNITGTHLYNRKDYNTDNYSRKKQLRLESNVHPFLTTLRDRIYTIDNKKVLDPHMLTLLDAEALAIIFMADGSTYLDSRFKNPHGSISLHTKGFSYHDNMALSKTIFEKLNIRTTVNRHNNYYFLRVKTADIILFVSTVLPYIKPSFTYKLERLTPILGDDIVCSLQQCKESSRND